jgi:hypothetical protein
MLGINLVGLAVALLADEVAAGPTPEQQQWLAKAHRFERHGWIYVHLEGEAAARGFQAGYLLAPEIARGLSTSRVSWKHLSGMDWHWLVERASALFASHIDPDTDAELEGIAAGLRAAGRAGARDEIVAYNAYNELSGYWWPLELKKIKDAPVPAAARQSCSSFIATGSMTRDGNVVLGHNTMMDYNDVFPNVIADIVPDRGHRILWQTCAGWIHSGTDFFITDAGLVGSETTIGGFAGFDTNTIPEFVRMRNATLQAGSIDQWCQIMRQGNNGGYANAWLLGDIHSREIARLELGLKAVGFERKADGFFIGSNVAEDLKLLRLETDAKDTDIRTSSVARRVRWKQLMKQSTGRIDLALAKQMEADHFDSFLKKNSPGPRSLCGHFEFDTVGGGASAVPFECSGTVDAKVVDAAMAGKMSFAARWGTACGLNFDAGRYLADHPQFDWMQEILQSRPSEPWTEFRGGE